MKMVAAIPASRAAHATACPWFPALAATTPATRSASLSVAILFSAPRSLKEPVRWRFSALSRISRPAIREKVSEPNTGVSRTTPTMRARAASTSARVGASISTDLEHTLQHLLDCTQWIEPALLYLVEEPAQLLVPGDRPLEVRLRACRREREHLRGEPLAAAALERARRLEVRAVRVDRGPQLVDRRALDRLRQDDRDRPPLA